MSTPEIDPKNFDAKLDQATCNAFCAQIDAATNSRDTKRLYQLQAEKMRGHLRAHARSISLELNPFVEALTKAPPTEALFRRFLPGVLAGKRITASEQAALSDGEKRGLQVVIDMVRNQREQAETMAMAIRLLTPVREKNFEQVAIGLINEELLEKNRVSVRSIPLRSQRDGDRWTLTVSIQSEGNKPYEEEWWITREENELRYLVDCPHCEDTKRELIKGR